MIRALALCLAIVPSLGHALSCLPWGVTDAYLQADAADAAYIIVEGDLTFDERLLPQVDMDNQGDTPPLTVIPARIKGHAWGRGTDVPFEADVTLNVECYGPWCAGAPLGRVLAFLRKDADGYSINTNPCGWHVFGEPSDDQMADVRTCMAGGACPTMLERLQ